MRLMARSLRSDQPIDDLELKPTSLADVMKVAAPEMPRRLEPEDPNAPRRSRLRSTGRS